MILKDEVEHKKDSNYDNFFQLVEQKDAKIKLLESRIKILQVFDLFNNDFKNEYLSNILKMISFFFQKYLTQRDVFS